MRRVREHALRAAYVPKNNDNNNNNNVNIMNYHACLSAHCYYDCYARRGKYYIIIVKRGCYQKCRVKYYV